VRVLAVDSSARRRLVVAVAGGDGDLLDGRVSVDAALDVALPTLLAGLLRPAPDAVVAVTGPGSYTGVRAGMAAALGVAQALRVPLHGVGALQVVSFAAPEGTGEVLAVADAGRGGVHLARHRREGRGWTPLEPPRRAGAADLTLPEGMVVVTLDDPPPLGGALRGDPLRALAAAAAQALGRPVLASSGLRAEYGDAGGSPRSSTV
jgi:tRNA threonylcarbamoyl adenosine modification protein YeaZ